MSDEGYRVIVDGRLYRVSYRDGTTYRWARTVSGRYRHWKTRAAAQAWCDAQNERAARSSEKEGE